MKEITSVEEFKKAIAREAVIDFNADWCGPCQMLKPTLEKFADRVAIFGVNIDELPELAEEFEVQSIPCLVKFSGGAETDRIVGLVPERRLRKWLDYDNQDVEDDRSEGDDEGGEA